MHIAIHEKDLVLRAKAGDRVAMDELIRSHWASITAQARRMLRSPEDVDDAVQETFLKAFRAMKSFDEDRPLGPWLLRICSNCCVDIIRGRSAQAESIDNYEYSLAAPGMDVDTGAESNLMVEALGEAIKRLPKRYREIMLMRHCNHMDVNEIAEALGKPEGTIKSWLFRARAMLRKSMQPTAA